MRHLRAQLVPWFIAMASVVGLALPAAAQTFTWTDGTGNWSNAANWSPGQPISSPLTTLIFPGATSYTATNDLGPFQLNQLWAGPAGGATITLAGAPLNFNGADRLIIQFGSGGLTVNNAVTLSGLTTVTGSGMGTVALNGGTTGGGGLAIAAAGVVMLSGVNDYAGGTFVRSGVLSYAADSAIGAPTAPVLLQGGALRYTGAADTMPNRTVSVEAASTIGVSSAATSLIVQGPLSGSGTLTKEGPGILLVSPGAGTTDTFFGGFNVTDGTLQTFGAPATTALRMNRINLGGTAGFVHTGAAAAPHHGELSGPGVYNVGTNGASILAISDQTFTGTVTLGSAGNGLTVRGTGTQTLTGATAAFNGPITLGSRAGLTLGGTATAIGAAASLTLFDRGTLTFDNSGTVVPNRFLDSGNVNASGGNVVLVGNAAFAGQVSETLGGYTINSGQNVVEVRHPAGAAMATVLSFASFTRGATGTSVNFASPGSAFVPFGNVGPTVLFNTPPPLTNGVIANTAGSAALGFAIANGTDFASYNNGVAAVASTPIAGPLANPAIPATTNARLTGDATIAAGATFSLNTLKISPSAAGQSLAIGGGGVLDTVGILLDGTAGFDYTINGGTIPGGATRHFHVWDANRMLTVGSVLAGNTTSPVTKSGDGHLNLTAAGTNFTSLTQVNLAGGTMRAAATYFGANSVLRFRGGVYEIDSAGVPGTTFTRALGTAAGQMAFDNSAGFSAFDSSAAGNVGVTVTIAGGVQAWGGANFVQPGAALLFGSNRSNAAITLTNDIDLTGGATNYNAREVRVFDNPGSANDRTVLSGVLSGAATTDLLKTGPGTLELIGGSTYAGNTIVSGGTLVHSYNGVAQAGSYIVQQGATLQLGLNGTLSAQPTSTMALQGGTLDVNGRLAVVGTLAVNGGQIVSSTGPGAVRAANNLITANGAARLFETVSIQLTAGATTDVVVTGGMLTVLGSVGQTGAGAGLTKAGPGTLELRGAGMFTGPTTVNGGTLLANNDQSSATGAGPVFVNAGTLGGVRVGGPVTIRAGGHIAPGTSPGTLVVGGAVTLSAGSTYDAELGAGGVSDMLSMGTNPLNIFDGTIFSITGVRDAAPQTYTLASLTTANNILQNGTTAVMDGFVFATLTVGTAQNPSDAVVLTASTVTFMSGDSFTLKRQMNNLVLAYVPVPEPAAVMAVFLAGAAVYWRRRGAVGLSA